MIFEYIPKRDPQVERLLSSRLDIFPDYALEGFRQAFSEYYSILDEQPVQGSERTMFLIKKR